jgi:hypothetical protein
VALINKFQFGTANRELLLIVDDVNNAKAPEAPELFPVAKASEAA